MVAMLSTVATFSWQDYINGTPNMGSKRFDTERSEVENLVE